MSEVTISAAQLNLLLTILREILGRDPLMTEVAQVLEVISTFPKEGG